MLNLIKGAKDFFTREGCFKDREKDGIASFGVCNGLVGGTPATEWLQEACIGCKYYGGTD
jgi:hypothetical protein